MVGIVMHLFLTGQVDDIASLLAFGINVFYLAEQMGRYIPFLPGLSNNRDRFLIIFDKRTDLFASARRLEADLLARIKSHHFFVAVHGLKKFKPRNNSIV